MEKKQCSKCKEWKDLYCFNKNKNNKDGLQYWCRKCGKKYNKENKEHHSEWCKEYHEKNINQISKRKKKNYKEHKEYYNKTSKKYYENNKEGCLKRSKKNKKLPMKFNSKSKYRKEIELYEEVKESKEGYLECKCAYCGDWFTPTYVNISHRIYVMNGDKNKGEGRLYCSEVCKKACPTFNQKLYPKGFKQATSREVQPELRQMVLARDNYTCQRCNKHKDELDVALHCHHLEGILWEPLMSADLDMCITYCQPCHVKAHQTPGCGYHDMQCTDIWKE